MILGLGIDLFPIRRLQRVLERDGESFLDEFLSPREREHASGLAGQAALSFAGKEAVFKALGTGRNGPLGWRQIEILPHADPGGPPRVELSGATLDLATKLGVTDVHLHVTRSRTHVLASAVLAAAPSASKGDPS